MVRNEEEKEIKIKNYKEVTKKEKEENEIITSSYYNYYEGITILIKFENKNLIFILNNLQEIFIFDQNFDKYDTYQTNLSDNKNELSVFKKF